MKDFADDNLKFDKYVWKFSKMLENNVGKGEIARSEQFLLFSFSHSIFKKTCTADM